MPQAAELLGVCFAPASNLFPSRITQGRAWHRAARGPSKHVSVSDTVACIEHLVSCGLAKSDAVIIRGESAGGIVLGQILVGAPVFAVSVPVTGGCPHACARFRCTMLVVPVSSFSFVCGGGVRDAFQDGSASALRAVLNDLLQKTANAVLEWTQNSHPGLVAGVIGQCPFLDVAATMATSKSLLELLERDEWGDPATPEVRYR